MYKASHKYGSGSYRLVYQRGCAGMDAWSPDQPDSPYRYEDKSFAKSMNALMLRARAI